MRIRKRFLIMFFLTCFALLAVWQQQKIIKLAYSNNTLKKEFNQRTHTLDSQRVIIAELNSPRILRKHCQALSLNLRPNVSWELAKQRDNGKNNLELAYHKNSSRQKKE